MFYLLSQLLRFEIPFALTELDLLLFNQHMFSEKMFDITCTAIFIVAVLAHATLREHERRVKEQAEHERLRLQEERKLMGLKRRRKAAKRRRLQPAYQQSKAAKNP